MVCKECGKEIPEGALYCEFIIDYLKTEAPFWKKEKVGEGTRWVQAKETDEAAKSKWSK